MTDKDYDLGQGWTNDMMGFVHNFGNGEFSLFEFCNKFHDELARRHPNNHTIDASIRRQLQVLRDKGIIRFIGIGRYKVSSPGSTERETIKSDMNRDFDAVKFQQGVGHGHGQEMFLFAAPTSWLLKAKVDKWRPEIDDDNLDVQGYQRAVSESHLRDIARYLKGAIGHATPTRSLPVFPTSVLLSSRKPLTFVPSCDGAGQGPTWAVPGKLQIPAEAELWIVDGQHRIEGLRAAILDAPQEQIALILDYHLPVTVMICQNKIDEILHFVTINKEAKSVRTDLAERLLDTIQKNNPELIADPMIKRAVNKRSLALAIVTTLETQKDQPWFGRIAKPNEPRGGFKVASEGQLSKSLRHICSALSVSWSEKKLTDFIVDFWITLAELLTKAFEEPQNFVIQKGPGFASLHRLLPNIVQLYKGRESLKDLLKGIDPYFTDVTFWGKGGEAAQHSSEGGYQILADRMLNALRNKLSD